MNSIVELFEKLTAFDGIVFSEDHHSYVFDGVPMESVTKIAGSVKKPFDAPMIAKLKAAKNVAAGDTSCTPEKLLAEWAMTNKISTVKGTICHEYIENYLAHKVHPYPVDIVRTNFGSSDPVKDKVSAVCGLMRKFCSDIRGKMLPVKSELVVGDKDMRLCGMIDQLFWNKKSGRFEIWDWKTNSKFEVDSPYKLIGAAAGRPDCELVNYSIQLGLYRRILSKNTGIDIGDCYLCWFNEGNSDYRIFKTIDVEPVIDTILDGRRQ